MAEWSEGKKENKNTFSFSYTFSYEYSSYYMIYGKNAKNARSSKKMAHYLFFPCQLGTWLFSVNSAII